MKKLIMLNGTMGVGKTAVCQALLETLEPAVFLDGDWCWLMRPFVVTDETKAMVMDNIAHLLNNFLRASVFDYVIFCWVMQEQAILDDVLSRLQPGAYETHCFTLTAARETLIARLQADIDAGLRQNDVIQRSLARMPLYDQLQTTKIDTTHLTVTQTAQAIAKVVQTKI